MKFREGWVQLCQENNTNLKSYNIACLSLQLDPPKVRHIIWRSEWVVHHFVETKQLIDSATRDENELR